MCSYGVWYGSDVDQGVGEKLGIHNFCRKLGLKTAVSFFKITELVAGKIEKLYPHNSLQSYTWGLEQWFRWFPGKVSQVKMSPSRSVPGSDHSCVPHRVGGFRACRAMDSCIVCRARDLFLLPFCMTVASFACVLIP